MDSWPDGNSKLEGNIRGEFYGELEGGIKSRLVGEREGAVDGQFDGELQGAEIVDVGGKSNPLN